MSWQLDRSITAPISAASSQGTVSLMMYAWYPEGKWAADLDPFTFPSPWLHSVWWGVPRWRMEVAGALPDYCKDEHWWISSSVPTRLPSTWLHSKMYLPVWGWLQLIKLCLSSMDHFWVRYFSLRERGGCHDVALMLKLSLFNSMLQRSLHVSFIFSVFQKSAWFLLLTPVSFHHGSVFAR